MREVPGSIPGAAHAFVALSCAAAPLRGAATGCNQMAVGGFASIGAIGSVGAAGDTTDKVRAGKKDEAHGSLAQW